MKITKKQLIKMIREMVYVNPKGEAVVPDDVKPYSFMASHPSDAISDLGSHSDIENRKMAAFLAGDKYDEMGSQEEEIHKLHKDLEAKHQLDKLSKIGFASKFHAEAPRDQDTIFKNYEPDSRQAKMITKHIDKYKTQIEQIVGDYIFSSNRYHDYLEDYERGAVLSPQSSLASLLYDTSQIVLDNIPQLSRIVKIYDGKMEHRMVNAIIIKIKNVIHDYLLYDRGLYDMFYRPKGNKR